MYIPMEMSRTQVVVMEEKVYRGGGFTDDKFHMVQYNTPI